MGSRNIQAPNIDRHLITESFNDFYENKGYSFSNSVSIASKVDPTVVYVGSTINVLKPYLVEGVPSPGLYINQPCLRAWNQEQFYNDSAISYNSFFNSCAVLAPANSEVRVVAEALEYLCSLPEMSDDRIVINVSSKDEILREVVSDSGVDKNNLHFDTKNDGYYKWSYGQKDLVGSGLTIAIKDGRGSYSDIGNVISVMYDGSAIAVEWGFGIETLLSRIHCLSQPIAASKICEVIAYEPGLRAKFLDTFMATLEMYKAGVVPGKSGQQYILKNYLKGLSYLRRQIGLTNDDIVAFGLEYLGDRSSPIPNTMIEWLCLHEQRVIKLQGRLALLKTVEEIDAARAIKFWNSDYGVNVNEAELILKQNLKL